MEPNEEAETMQMAFSCKRDPGAGSSRCQTVVAAVVLFLFLTALAGAVLAFIYQHQSKKAVQDQLQLFGYKTLHEGDELLQKVSSLRHDILLLHDSPGVALLIKKGDPSLLRQELEALCHMGAGWDFIGVVEQSGPVVAGISPLREGCRSDARSTQGFFPKAFSRLPVPPAGRISIRLHDPFPGEGGGAIPHLLFLVPLGKEPGGKKLLLIGCFPLEKLAAKMPFNFRLVDESGRVLMRRSGDVVWPAPGSQGTTAMPEAEPEIWKEMQKRRTGAIMLEERLVAFTLLEIPTSIPLQRTKGTRERTKKAPPLRLRLVITVPVDDSISKGLKQLLLIVFGFVTAANLLVSSAFYRMVCSIGEAETRFRTAFYTSPDAMLLIDGTGRISEANEAACKLLGMTGEELKGRRVSALGLIAHSSEEQPWQQAPLPDIENMEVSLHRGERGGKTCLLSSTRIESGGKPFSLLILRDISTLKQAEAQRLELERQLRNAHKMEALGVLATGIAHDFNNILTAILGYAELAYISLEEWHQARSDLQQVLEAGKRAKELIHQLLTIGRQLPGERKPINVVPIIKETLKLIRASIPSNISINQEVTSEEMIVNTDPSSINQLLMNLCVNAYHAMEDCENGLITVTVAKERQAGEKEGEWLKLEVTDTGSGIPDDIMPRIFDPYFSTKPQSKGTGLGLAVVKGIVEGLGGTIEVESRVGEGSKFKIVIPLSEPDEGENLDRAGEVTLPGGTERILVLDDEPHVAETLRRMLSSLGYAVVSVTDSKSGMELIENIASEFDLVITDLAMPEVSGTAIARKVKEVSPRTPVIVCTGYAKEIVSGEGKQLQVDGIIYKPVDREVLATTVRKVLDGLKEGSRSSASAG